MVQPGSSGNRCAGDSEDVLFKNSHFQSRTSSRHRSYWFSRKVADQLASIDQRKLILTKTPTKSVVAGAGSGKSTAMSVAAIGHYLRIDFTNLIVMTFSVQEDVAEK